MSEVTIQISPEFLVNGEVRAEVTIYIPTELLCIPSEIEVLGERLHPHWGYSCDGDRYNRMTVPPSEVDEIVESIKSYAHDVRSRQAQLDKNGKTIILEV